MSKRSYIQAYRSKHTHHVIGLMSGTSLDGVDGVLVQIVSDEANRVMSVTVVDRVSIDYSPQLRKRVSDLCIPGNADISDVTIAHAGLAHWYAHVVNVLKERNSMPIDVVGLHGQTVWHEPMGREFPLPQGNKSITATLQLGNPQVLSTLCDLPVVSDFRSSDMAVGGEGAPLAPFIDHLLFSDDGMGVAVQNIGGIGNVTILAQGGGPETLWAFDTGPGNMVIDAVVQWGSEGLARYDDEGAIAARGEVDHQVVDSLMQDPYFVKEPPKSTGREVYGQAFTTALIQRCVASGLSYPDIVATATAFTARSISESYRRFILPHVDLGRVVVSGGGARNKTLLAMIADDLNIDVLSSTELGILDTDREAMAFALLAHSSMMGVPSNIPAVTGAQRSMVLGTVTMEQL